MAHTHHTHNHDHSHSFDRVSRAFALGVALNVLFVAIEGTFGFLSGSLALLADAGHNLGDVMSLLLAWGAHALSRRRPTQRRTYGYRSTSILAALMNALILIVAVGAIAWEAARRFQDPHPVPAITVIVVAAIGLVINGITAWLFFEGRKRDLNLRGAYLHMAADAAVSAGVVVAGALIAFTGFAWIDPVTSLVIAAVILIGTWGLLRDSVELALHAVPPGIDPSAVEAYLAGLPGVTGVHDLHIWGMSTTDSALTAHIVKPDAKDDDALLQKITEELHARFGIEHMTIQWERSDLPRPCVGCEADAPPVASGVSR